MGVIDLSEKECLSSAVKETIIRDASKNLYTQKQIFHSLVASFRIYETINKAEKLAKYYNISRKARGLEKPVKSDQGFLVVYKKTKGKKPLNTQEVSELHIFPAQAFLEKLKHRLDS